MAQMVFSMSGLMQGFGDSGSTQDFRKCSIVPKDQSIVGLLSAALGYEKNSPKIEELGNKISIQVDLVKRGRKLEDFQTVNGRRSYVYDANGKVVKQGIKRVDGGTNYNPIVMRKEYRVGVEYLVTVESDEETIGMLRDAIRKPYYPLYLGKASCIGNIYLLEDIKCNQTDI